MIKMIVKKLLLKDFRNYEKLDLEFDQKINVFIGDNGQGKTNILEAIYLTSIGKSFRTGRDMEMIRFEAPFLRVETEAVKGGEPLSVEMVISEDRKAIKIDGVTITKSSDLLDHIYTVVFSPEDLKIVKDEPEKRRRFMDREISQLKPSYFLNLSMYKKALVQRNALLKDCNLKEDNLLVWDESLAAYGELIIKERAKFVEKLGAISREIHDNITEGKEHLSLSYEKDGEGDLRELFLKGRKIDRIRGTTCRGPHRDDLKIFINDVDIRTFGSQGQQRTAALALKLAELKLIKEETGEEGVLLLDDVLSELDAKRQRFLLEYLKEVQMFITSAEINKPMEEMFLRGNLFKVISGKVYEETKT